MQVGRQRGIQTDKSQIQAGRTSRQTDRKTGSQTNRQTGKQTGRQAYMHAGRPTEIHTDKQSTQTGRHKTQTPFFKTPAGVVCRI